MPLEIWCVLATVKHNDESIHGPLTPLIRLSLETLPLRETTLTFAVFGYWVGFLKKELFSHKINVLVREFHYISLQCTRHVKKHISFVDQHLIRIVNQCKTREHT